MDIKSAVQMDEIPAQLIVNWDQTGINYIPVSNWTMEQAGSKRVEIVGKDDKRQITALFGCTMLGDFLPPQLVYQGKTNQCLPRYTFPSSWTSSLPTIIGATNKLHIAILLTFSCHTSRKRRWNSKWMPINVHC